jgi:hypothetical protein
VLFYHRLGKLPYLLGDLHKNSSIQQERVGIAPHSLVKLLSIDPIVAQFFPFCKGKIKKRWVKIRKNPTEKYFFSNA